MTQNKLSDADSDLDQQRWTALAAKAEVGQLTTLRNMSMGQAVDAQKWLTASLMAVNGAGAITAAGLKGQQEIGLAAFSFIFGIGLALTNALLIQSSGFKSLPWMGKLIGYWISVADDGERVEQFEDQLRDEEKPWRRLGLAARTAGWLSAIAFFTGAWLLYTAPERADPRKAALCLEVQVDMISDQPRRSDGPDVFQALGCKHQRLPRNARDAARH
jgi:hypothetical protein